MQRKILIAFAGILLIALGIQQWEINTLQNEKDQIKTEYSYAMDMLGGMLKDPNGVKESVRSIQQDSLDTI